MDTVRVNLDWITPEKTDIKHPETFSSPFREESVSKYRDLRDELECCFGGVERLEADTIFDNLNF